VKAIKDTMESDPEKAKKYAEILYNQSLLIAGLPIDDPSGYADIVCSLFD
jgi:molecular chaperone HtpG